MTVTYTDDTVAPAVNDTYVPAYARKPVRQKKVRTWMVLAPIAAVALIGGGAYMLMNSGGETTAPLVEPVSAPVASPMVAAPTTEAAAAPMTATATPAPVEAAPAPVARTVAPVRSAPPVARRESTPVRSTPTPRVEAPAEPTGPQPYAGAASLNAATPAPRVATPAVTPSAPATAPAAPAIVVQPLN